MSLWWLLIFPITVITACAFRELDKRKHRLVVAPDRVRHVENPELTTTLDRIAKVAADRDALPERVPLPIEYPNGGITFAARPKPEDVHHKPLGDGGWYDPAHSRFKPGEETWDEPWSADAVGATADAVSEDAAVLAVRNRCTNFLALNDEEPETSLDDFMFVVNTSTQPPVEPEIVEGVIVDGPSWSEANRWDFRQHWPLILAAARGNVDENLVLRPRTDDSIPPLFAETAGRHRMPEAPTLDGFTESWERGSLNRMIEAGA